MSINDAQRQQTSRELHQLRALIDTSDEVLAQRLGYANPDELQDVLNISEETYPSEVWRVRDFLESIAISKGIKVPKFSVLKASKRKDAEGWFGTWSVPSIKDL